MGSSDTARPRVGSIVATRPRGYVIELLKRYRFCFASLIGGIISILFGVAQNLLDGDNDGKSNLQEYIASIDENHDGQVSAGEYASAAAVPLGVMAFGTTTGLILIAVIAAIWLALEGGRHLKRLGNMQFSSIFGEDFECAESLGNAGMSDYLTSEFTAQAPLTTRALSEGSGLKRRSSSAHRGMKKVQGAVQKMRTARSFGALSGNVPGTLADLSSRLHEWNLDLFEITKETKQPLSMVGMACLDESSYDELPFVIDKLKLSMFLTAMEDSYRNVAYHNSLHAASVSKMVFSFCKACGLGRKLASDMQFTLVLAGIAHDVHHPGLTAPFLSKASTKWKFPLTDPLEESDMELAMKYNDQSPLENMHCAVTFSLLREERHAFLPAETIASIKPILVKAILGTDMAKHAETMKRLQMLIDNLESPAGVVVPWYWPLAPPPGVKPGSEDFEKFKQSTQVGFVMELFLHAADIGTPCLPLDQWKRWNRRVTEEFHNQGDLEMQEFGRYISPQVGFDRSASEKDQHNFTKGFMMFLSQPYWKGLDRLTKFNSSENIAHGVDISVCIANLNSNIKVWEETVFDDDGL